MSAADIAQEADVLHSANKVHEVYGLLETTVDKDGKKDPSLLWRFARACYLVSSEKEDKAEKQALVRRGVDLVKESVDKDASDGQAHKWTGILLGSLGDFVATKEKIMNSFTIKEEFDKAAELIPQDATVHHCIGKWHWSILQVSFVERSLAATLFASPPKSSYEECEAALMKCYELDPKHQNNLLLLGDLLYSKRKWQDAKQWYQRTAEVEVVTEFQKQVQQEAVAKAKKCG